MKILNIGDKITYTTSKGSFVGVVAGRNWAYQYLISYIVTHNYDSIPVCAKTFKCQIAS